MIKCTAGCEQLWYFGWFFRVIIPIFSSLCLLCACFVLSILVCQGNLRGFTYRLMNFYLWSYHTHTFNGKKCMIIQWKFYLMLSPWIPLDYVSFFSPFLAAFEIRTANSLKLKIIMLLCVHFNQPKKNNTT